MLAAMDFAYYSFYKCNIKRRGSFNIFFLNFPSHLVSVLHEIESRTTFCNNDIMISLNTIS